MQIFPQGQTILVVVILLPVIILILAVWIDKIIKKKEEPLQDKATGDLEAAVMHIEKREYAKAKEELDVLINIYPEYAEAYRKRGLINLATDNLQSALLDINKALELQPTEAEYYRDRGLIYRSLRDEQLALHDFLKVIELNPGYINVYDDIGNSYTNISAFDEAKNAFTKGIEKATDPLYFYMKRSALYYDSLKDYTSALRDINKAIDLSPESDSLYTTRAIIQKSLHDDTAMIADLTKAIEINSNNITARSRRGLANIIRKEYSAALVDFNKIIELQPENALAHRARASSYIGLKNPGRAKIDLQRSLEIEPDNPYAIYNMACIFAEENQLSLVYEWLKRAISLERSLLEHAQTDESFASIRDTAEFQAIINEKPNEEGSVIPL